MPMSSAGLTRFNEASSSRLQITPGHVVIMVGVVIVLVILMHLYGNTLLGL